MLNPAALILAAPPKSAFCAHELARGSYSQKSFFSMPSMPVPTNPLLPMLKLTAPYLAVPPKLAFCTQLLGVVCTGSVVLPVTFRPQFSIQLLPSYILMHWLSVLNICRPVAGDTIAFRCSVDIRGIKKPLLVLFTSSIAELAGETVPIPTFCA